jgi:hypothetical protein
MQCRTTGILPLHLEFVRAVPPVRVGTPYHSRLIGQDVLNMCSSIDGGEPSRDAVTIAPLALSYASQTDGVK